MSEYDSDYEEEADQLEDDVVESPAPARNGGKWTQRCFVLILLVLVLPSVVSITGIGGRGLKWLNPSLGDVTEFDQLSLHWWAPVECRGLRLSNTREWSREAPPLLTVERVTTRQPLWKIALNMGQGIDVTLHRPELVLLNSEAGTNLTDAMEDLTNDESSGRSHFPFRMTVMDGRIHVARDAAAAGSEAPRYDTEALVSGIQCEVSTLDSMSFVPDVSLVATLGDHVADSTVASANTLSAETSVHPRIAAKLDDLAADFQPLQIENPDWNDAASSVPSIEVRMGSVEGSSQRSMRFAARGLELDTLEPLIAQWLPGIRCRGLLSLKGEALMLGTSATDGVALRLAARGADVQWRQKSWSQDERLDMSSASADIAVAVAEDGIIVQTLSADCPFASIDGHGEIRVPAEHLLKSILNSDPQSNSNRVSAVSEAQAAADGQVNIQGQVDLVALSRMLPDTLRLREGLQLQEGTVQFDVRTQSAIAHERLEELGWQAVVETSPLVARVDRRTVRWDAPIRMKCTGPLRMSSIHLDSAELSGDFGRIDISPADQAVDVRARIDIDRLWGHLGQFVEAEPPGMRGDVSVEAWVGRPSSGDLALRNVKLQADNLRVESGSLVIRSSRPLLKMLDGQLSIRGSGAAVRSLAAPWTDLAWLAGESQVSVDLDAAPPQRLTVVAEVRPGATASASDRRWHNLSALRVTQAQVALDIDTDSEPDHYVIRSGRIRLPGIHAELSGTLESVGDWMTTQLEVDADYDLAVLSRMMLNDPTGAIQIVGRNRSRFEIQGAPAFWDGSGPTEAPAFEVNGAVAWESADIYGLQFGSGTAPFRLQEGQIQTEPIRSSLNGGQLNAMVNYDLRQNQLALASGSRVENMQVTEEVAHRWMTYVAPFLVDAANVRGSVSARVSHFQYNIDHPEFSEALGTIDIHSMTASPGNSLAVLLQALDTLRPGRRSLVRDLTMPAQEVRFRAQDGLISHDQLLLALSGYQMRSQGTVGFNKQLNLLLDVPLERSGRSVSVPVQGTVSRPSIDLGRLMQDVGTRRIESEINDQLDRGLNRLFDRLR